MGAELEGFREALDANGVDSADFLSVGRSFTRLFRDGGYPPLRGTLLTLDHRTHALYTRGSVDFFATYPGMYVPSALRLLCEEVEQTPAFLAGEILALTKMNWPTRDMRMRPSQAPPPAAPKKAAAMV